MHNLPIRFKVTPSICLDTIARFINKHAKVDKDKTIHVYFLGPTLYAEVQIPQTKIFQLAELLYTTYSITTENSLYTIKDVS